MLKSSGKKNAAKEDLGRCWAFLILLLTVLFDWFVGVWDFIIFKPNNNEIMICSFVWRAPLLIGGGTGIDPRQIQTTCQLMADFLEQICFAREAVQSRYLMVTFPSLYSDTMIPDSITKDVCFDNFCVFFCLGIANRYFGEDILVKYQTKIQWRYFSFLLLYSNQFVEPLEDGLVISHRFPTKRSPSWNSFLVSQQPWKPGRCVWNFARLSSFRAGCLVCLLGYLVIGCVEGVMSNQMIFQVRFLEIFVLSRPEKILKSHITYIYMNMETNFELGGILHMNVWPDVLELWL